MANELIIRQINDWTIQTLAGGRHLARLYRVLGDDRQAAAVLRAMRPAEERALRSGLGARVPAALAALHEAHPGETGGEAAGWEAMLAALAGMCACYAIVEGHDKAAALRGARDTTLKALQAGVGGMRTTFPDGEAERVLAVAIRSAARACADASARDLEGEGISGVEGNQHRENLFRQIEAALLAEVAPISTSPEKVFSSGSTEKRK